MIRMRTILALAVAMTVIFTLVSCYSAGEAPVAMKADKSTASQPAKSMAEQKEGGDLGGGGDKDGLPSVENLAAKGRKLIRDGSMTFTVKDLEDSREKLENLVKQAGGFVSNVNFTRQHYLHTISLELRLPSDGFSGAIDAIRKLGRIDQESIKVTDVTDRWVDLGRRIRAQELMAERLEELILSSKYAFKDLLEVEKELSNIRLEIERLKGTKRGLDDRISLSTLTVTLQQEVAYHKQLDAPPSVFDPIINTIENAGPRFKRSFRAVLSFITGLINFVLVMIPWLVVIIPAYYLLRWAARRIFGKGRKAGPSPK